MGARLQTGGERVSCLHGGAVKGKRGRVTRLAVTVRVTAVSFTELTGHEGARRGL